MCYDRVIRTAPLYVLYMYAVRDILKELLRVACCKHENLGGCTKQCSRKTVPKASQSLKTSGIAGFKNPSCISNKSGSKTSERSGYRDREPNKAVKKT